MDIKKHKMFIPKFKGYGEIKTNLFHGAICLIFFLKWDQRNMGQKYEYCLDRNHSMSLRIVLNWQVSSR